MRKSVISWRLSDRVGAGRWGCGENGAGWEVGWLALVVHC